MLTSHDILVGADAFLERRSQVLLDHGVQFARYHDDPFRQVSSIVEGLRAVARRSLFYAGVQVVWDYDEQPVPADLVRFLMSMHERGTANRAAYAWLCRTEADDDLEVLGITFHEFRDLDLTAEPNLTWATAK